MAINLYNVQIEELFINQVGNKTRSEGVIYNEHRTELNDEIRPLVKEFFFKSFREKDRAWYQFVHESDLDFHEMYRQSVNLFSGALKLGDYARAVSRHMYAQSNHPHVKPGEVYFAKLSNVMVDNEKFNAIGIFKSELKHDFLQFRTGENQLELLLQEGVHLGKLDKGAIIINTDQESGFNILCVDSYKYDTKYWFENVMGIDALHDDHFHTKKYLKFCQDFAKDVVRPAGDKREELLFMNRAINHFRTHDTWDQDEFLTEVLGDPGLQAEYEHYKLEKGSKYSIEDLSSFAISNEAIAPATKNFKSLIELDTNVAIKMNFINPESYDKFIEKGWDEERQMYYYLVYFNKESK